MKKKKSKIEIAIIVLFIILLILIYLYVNPDFPNFNSSDTTDTLSTSSTQTTEAVTTTIENTLSSSGQISSALDEKLSLHASYYFEELLVDTNVYITEGTNILEYTNGTYLTAPYDCVLVSSNLPNTEEICTTSHYIEIESIDTLAMSLSVSETDINKVSIGDEVNITITAQNKNMTGYITAISEIGSYSSSGSNFTATVTFDNDGSLKIGMSASCDIVIEKAENVIAVPNEALQNSDEDGDYVIVVNDDGSTKNVSVEKGISNDAYTEIKSGITAGTKVQMSESSSDSSSSSSRSFGGGNFDKSSMGGGDFQMPSGGGSGSMPSMPSGGGSMPSMP